MKQESAHFLREAPDGCTLAVHVQPGAKKNGVTGIHAGAVRISLTTPPIEGRANEALIAFVAELLRIPRARISLLSGTTSRTKALHITGKYPPEVEAALFPIAPC
jgi:uncharacterized protein (TIGR00251 family)